MEHDGSKKTCNHIILVHGSCHGAWCWYKVTTLLTSAGYRVTAPDVAAAGIDETRLEDVPTFANYSEPLLEILQWMIENYSVKEVKRFEAADHMAMLSKPKEVCQCLMDIASKYSLN